MSKIFRWKCPSSMLTCSSHEGLTSYLHVAPVLIAEHLSPLPALEVTDADVEPAASAGTFVNQLVEGQAYGGQPFDGEVHEALHAPRVVRVRHEVGGPSGGVRARLRASYRPVEFRAPVSA